jgi:hypothetical protein
MYMYVSRFKNKIKGQSQKMVTFERSMKPSHYFFVCVFNIFLSSILQCYSNVNFRRASMDLLHASEMFTEPFFFACLQSWELPIEVR